MDIINLIDLPSRTKFFQQGILRNLQYWQAWVSQERTDPAALDRERDGIIRAISFALDLGEIAWPAACTLIMTFAPFMERRGYWEVWHEILNRALKAAQQFEDIVRLANLSGVSARLLYRQGRIRASTAAYRQAIRLSRQIGDQFGEARACTNLGYAYVEKGTWFRAEVLCCHALHLFEQINNDHGRAHTESHLGILYTLQGEWAKAGHHLERACAIWQVMGDPHGLMYGCLNLSTLYIYMEHPVEALAYAEKALQLAGLSGEEAETGTIYLNMGLAYKLKGELIEAEAYTQRAKVIFQRFSNSFELANAQENLGAIYLDQQKWLEARLHLQASWQAWRSLNNKYGEIHTMILFVKYELAQGNQSQAHLWLQEVEAQLRQYDRTGQYRLLHQQVDKLRRSLM